MIGCYLLNEEPVYEEPVYQDEKFEIFEDLSSYNKKRSVHGVALALLPEFRGIGYGRLLCAFPCQPYKYDYIWGYHEKTLNNIAEWEKFGRRIVGESKECYVTLMDLRI